MKMNPGHDSIQIHGYGNELNPSKGSFRLAVEVLTGAIPLQCLFYAAAFAYHGRC